jgi:hypothetical protein
MSFKCYCGLCRQRQQEAQDRFLASFVGEVVEVVLVDGRSVFGPLVAFDRDEVILQGRKNSVRYR